jgi:hypothetical protein
MKSITVFNMNSTTSVAELEQQPQADLKSLLSDLYYNIQSHPESALSSVKKLQQAVSNVKKQTVPIQIVRKYLSGQHAYTKHRPSVKVAVRRNRMLAGGIGTSYQADLADVQSLARKRGNRGVRFLLCVIDIFTKVAWVRPLKHKTAGEVRDAFESIWTDPQLAPQMPTNSNARITMATDKGREFLNSTVQRWFKEHNIHHYTLSGDHKAAVVERFQRTLKDRLHRLMSSRSEAYKYVNMLPTVVSAYNNSVHSTLSGSLRPVDVNRENEQKIWQLQFNRLAKKRYTRRPRDDLKVGDIVLASIAKQPFQKGYLEYWHNERFRVVEIRQGIPNKSYRLVSVVDGVPIEGVFYREQLQKVEENDIPPAL